MGGSRKDTSAGQGPCSKRSKVDIENYRGSLTQTASREHLPITKEYDATFDGKFYSTFNTTLLSLTTRFHDLVAKQQEDLEQEPILLEEFWFKSGR